MDVIFATAKSGDVYVFRHNFNGNKWENVTNKKDGSSLVTFRKRGNMFYIRIIPDGGTKVGGRGIREHAAAPRLCVSVSRDVYNVGGIPVVS